MKEKTDSMSECFTITSQEEREKKGRGENVLVLRKEE